MKNLSYRAIIIIGLLITSCKTFNPYGSWITADELKKQKTFQIKRAPDKNIRVKQLGVPNSVFSQYKRDSEVDSIIRYLIFETSNSQLKLVKPKSVLFETESRSIFNMNTTNKLAFRISKAEEPTPEVMREAIVREIKKRYPIVARNWNSGRINGESHRFENMTIKFSSTGILSISGKQTVNSCKGFTGRMIVRMLDIDGNVLGSKYFNPHGLGPKIKWFNPCAKNSRPYNYDVNLNREPSLTPEQVKQMVIGTYSFEILAERSSSSGRFEKSVERLKKATSDLKDIGQNIAEIYALVNGIPVNIHKE